jgi:hypothetical protein
MTDIKRKLDVLPEQENPKVKVRRKSNEDQHFAESVATPEDVEEEEEFVVKSSVIKAKQKSFFESDDEKGNCSFIIIIILLLLFE